MRIVINRELCIGAGQCVSAAPEVFAQDEDDGLVFLLLERPRSELHDSLRAAVRTCPVRAISAEPE